MTNFEQISLLVFFLVIAAVYCTETFLILRYLFGKFVKNNPKKKRFILSRPAICLHIIAVTGIFCIFYAFFIEPNWIQVNTVYIQTPKLKNTAIRIVQISDLHCEIKPRNEKRLIEIINSLKPDIIVFTGDCINNREALPLFRNTMQSLNAGIGKFAVYGNWCRKFIAMDLLKDTDFQLLNYKKIELEKNSEKFTVSGINSVKDPNISYLMKQLDPNLFNLFLYHSPDIVEDIKRYCVDLYLTGHTHGGQVALPFYGALITLAKHGKKYEAGLYKVDNTLLYVNRGIGLEGYFAPKIRFFARPEITVFEISPQKQYTAPDI